VSQSCLGCNVNLPPASALMCARPRSRRHIRVPLPAQPRKLADVPRSLHW